MERKLADAQSRGKTRLVKTINAKIKNRRKDTYHKFTREVVDRAGAAFVGNISSAWQIAAGNGKATHDASWSMLRSFLRYKCDHAGVAFAEVNEAYTTQTCSCCKALTGPKGEQGLNVRQWVCSDCSAEHDRDRNAAINIARLGREALGLQWPGSPIVHAGEASPGNVMSVKRSSRSEDAGCISTESLTAMTTRANSDSASSAI